MEWRRLGEELDAIVSSSRETFDPSTIANARDLLKAMQYGSSLPEIAKGYWSSFRFIWGSTLEIEVFAGHVEVYRFKDLHTDIQHYPHSSGSSFSPEVIEALTGLGR